MTSSTDQSDIGKMRTEVDGSFKRLAASFRSFIKNDGQFLPEKGRYLGHIHHLDKQTAQPKRTGRYRLYVSYACRELTSHHIAKLFSNVHFLSMGYENSYHSEIERTRGFHP